MRRNNSSRIEPFERMLPPFNVYNDLVPETSTLKWLFQLDDSKPLLEKWLFHQTSIKKWLFRVPGISY